MSNEKITRNSWKKVTTENLKLNLEQKHTVMNEVKNTDRTWQMIAAVDGTKHNYLAKRDKQLICRGKNTGVDDLGGNEQSDRWVNKRNDK